ncbi:MAG: C1 family peptidase [candidate division Zixibacteria bacterium]|nr:C1 family peptidase [candidate division Zixibacteria bacterium]
MFSLIILLSSQVYSQLSKEDIALLREQGQNEGWTFTVGETPATQRPLPAENSLLFPKIKKATALFKSRTAPSELPEVFDWRALDGCTPIKDQGSCGSCWAFGTVGALESAIKIVAHKTMDLSEQYLVSCNSDGFNCIYGGWFAFDYFQWKPDYCGGVGPVVERDFPYTANGRPCNCPYFHDYLIESWGYVGSNGLDSFYIPGVDEIKQAIYDYGPVAVAVYVNRAFAAYTGGVFNACENKPPNHIVDLVGWDDNLGYRGAWILRNSWNTDWGEDGYMYIEYGCSKVGLSACFVDYTGYSFYADTMVGWPPLDVNFYAWDNHQAASWVWSFGDGDSAFTQTPSHTYSESGRYTVTLTATGATETHEIVRENHIIVLADSLIAGQAGGGMDSLIEIPLVLANSIPLYRIIIPIEYSGPLDLEFQGYDTTGGRLGAAVNINLLHHDTNRKCLTLDIDYLNKNTRLDAGRGEVLKLQFVIKAGLPFEANILEVNGYDMYLPEFTGDLARYQPRLSPGSISHIIYQCCHGTTGNVDCSSDELVDIADITRLIDFLYTDHNELCCPEEADVDTSGGEPDIADITLLIDYLYLSHKPLPACP